MKHRWLNHRALFHVKHLGDLGNQTSFLVGLLPTLGVKIGVFHVKHPAFSLFFYKNSCKSSAYVL